MSEVRFCTSKFPQGTLYGNLIGHHGFHILALPRETYAVASGEIDIGGKMKLAPYSLVVAAGLAALLLSGCSAESGLRALDRAAAPEDILPSFVTLQEHVDRDSSRLLATRDGVRYFALQSDDARTTCLAVVPPGEGPDWQVGCSDTRRSGEIVNMSSLKDQLSTILLGDDSDTGKIEPGWTKIEDNVLVFDP